MNGDNALMSQILLRPKEFTVHPLIRDIELLEGATARTHEWLRTTEVKVGVLIRRPFTKQLGVNGANGIALARINVTVQRRVIQKLALNVRQPANVCGQSNSRLE